jgi:hypothetical protein
LAARSGFARCLQLNDTLLFLSRGHFDVRRIAVASDVCFSVTAPVLFCYRALFYWLWFVYELFLGTGLFLYYNSAFTLLYALHAFIFALPFHAAFYAHYKPPATRRILFTTYPFYTLLLPPLQH